MNRKRNIGILLATISIAALIFIIKGNLNVAVLLMTGLFALTNSFRAISFKEKGFEREAKWMKWMAILFTAAFFLVLFLVIL